MTTMRKQGRPARSARGTLLLAGPQCLRVTEGRTRPRGSALAVQTPESSPREFVVTARTPPVGLGAGGLALWRAVSRAHSLDAVQRVQLEEACRAKDRLDRLDELLREDSSTWMTLRHSSLTRDYELKVDNAAALANSTADHMKKLLNALRLPDAVTGRRPQRRGPRGVQAPAGVSSLDRARARQFGSRTKGHS